VQLGAPPGGHDLLNGLTPSGKRRFEWVGTDLMQRSMVDENLEWKVSQVIDSIDPRGSDTRASIIAHLNVLNRMNATKAASSP
jgi:hypothetical protein